MRTRYIPAPWKLWFTALLLLIVLPGAAWSRGNPEAKPGPASAAQYEIIVETDQKITMRDGTVIAATVQRPKAEGAFPVLVEGTPYGLNPSSEMGKGTHAYFVPRGYAVVSWGTRGRYGSEGEFTPLVNDRNDGYDVVEWAAGQPWSNGKVGLIGISYMGQVQLNTAIARPPHLVCAAPAMTAADLWREWFYRGGAMEYMFSAGWAGMRLGEDLARKSLSPEAFEAWKKQSEAMNADKAKAFNVVPAINFALAQMGERNLFKDWALHPTDSPYWRDMSPESGFDRIAVPMLHIGGWFDIFQAGCFKAFNGIGERGATALARENQRLAVGPWTHLDQKSTRQGISDFSPGLTETDYHDIRLAFFDYWLKNIQQESFALDEPVKIFVTGRNVWRNEKEWPPARVRPVRYFLGGGKSGSVASLNDGTLSVGLPAKGSAPQTFVYDPMSPLPTRGGGCLYMFAYGPDGLADSGPQDQRPLDAKSLTYTSAPLTRETEITGQVKAVLHAASSAVDTDWVVRLSDVAPDGTSVLVADGIQRARFRASGTEPALIEPGKTYEYEVDLWAVSHVFKQGHRIRVAVTSSNFPRWSRNMNVAEFPEQATTWEKATNTIYLDADKPSRITLPVIDH